MKFVQLLQVNKKDGGGYGFYGSVLTVKESFQQFVEDRINDRLTEGVEGKQKRNKGSFIEHLHNPMITDEEFEGFFVVKVT